MRRWGRNLTLLDWRCTAIQQLVLCDGMRWRVEQYARSLAGEFFLSGPAPDAGYANIRDLERNRNYKAFVEELWSEYHHLADTHFRQDAKAHFQQRFWEMYLSVALLRRGFDLHRIA